MKAALVATVLALALVVLPRAASADDPDPAVEHFNRGVALLDDAQYAGAATELERSLAIRETAPVLYNLGLAYRGVGRYQDAIKQFERFLQVRDEKKHKKMAALVDTLLQELKAALVHVELRVTGGASRVRLDGQPLAANDGIYPVTLDPGSHVFEAERSGYVAARQAVILKPGEQESISLDASTKPKPSKVTIEVTPLEAEIWIDGTLRGSGRYQAEMVSGTHSLRVHADGYDEAERSIRVGAGSQQQVSIELTRSSQPLTKKWWFWAGSAAVVGAAVLAVVITRPDQPSPHEGTLGFVTEALR